jgi:hypothetical protein
MNAGEYPCQRREREPSLWLIFYALIAAIPFMLWLRLKGWWEQT